MYLSKKHFQSTGGRQSKSESRDKLDIARYPKGQTRKTSTEPETGGKLLQMAANKQRSIAGNNHSDGDAYRQ